ncbi:hypothetical protein B0H19DRAFT_654295 [Mycena capillaripes]|nr:hypothetical protein B0H19DRAFT_654295 [Mycena capillaripes]
MGDAAFYVVGATRNEVGRVKTFEFSVMESETAPAFSQRLPDGCAEWRLTFKQWAEEVMPRDADEEELTVSTSGQDGAPMLPLWSKDLSTSDIRRLLMLYGSKLYGE